MATKISNTQAPTCFNGRGHSLLFGTSAPGANHGLVSLLRTPHLGLPDEIRRPYVEPPTSDVGCWTLDQTQREHSSSRQTALH